MYPKEITEIKERFFRQCYETLYDFSSEVNNGDTLSGYNHNICQNGFSPTLTTRPEGFKTAIVVVVNGQSNS